MSTVSADELITWLVSQIAMIADVPREKIGTSVHFSTYGLDSAATVELIADLEDRLGIDLPATLASEFPTVELLTEQLVLLMSQSAVPG